MQNDTNLEHKAIAALAELFYEKALCASEFASFEAASIEVGHKCIAEAVALALEALDAHLLEQKPDDLKVHDIRTRTLATEVGDVSFTCRRYRDKFGSEVYLLADKLDIPYNTRISPGAVSFLVDAAAHISYKKAANLLARHGSHVKATTVMKCLRDTGLLCAELDYKDAKSLYGDGVVPQASTEVEELCMEADGTYFRAQGVPKDAPKRFEVKAIVAYDGKEIKGGKVRRKGCVHHACVGSPNEIWTEGIASVGQRYDLSKIKRVHLGSDGERWCRDAEKYLPKAEVIHHLDPFHINRAILSCFPAVHKKMAWNIIEVIKDGDKKIAIELLRISCEEGIARKEVSERVIAYLKGNIDSIEIDGPNLGTMESENQHLYGVRMDSFPCAWSLQGATDMARIISRRESKREIPRMSRARSEGPRRKAQREKRELSFYERQGSYRSVVESSGSGYLPPHQVDTRRMSSGHAYALYKGMSKLR